MRLFIVCSLMFGLSLLAANQASAKRGPAPKVKPVTFKGIKFSSPNTLETMGVVQAWDIVSGKKVWEKKVYVIQLDPDMETDVQWKFITSLKIKSGRLYVANELGEKFEINIPREILKP